MGVVVVAVAAVVAVAIIVLVVGRAGAHRSLKWLTDIMGEQLHATRSKDSFLLLLRLLLLMTM